MTIRGLIVSIIMTIVLCIMTLGYAALQQRIDIQGEATVDSTYRVEITSVAEVQQQEMLEVYRHQVIMI